MQYKKTVLEQEIIRVSIDLFVRKGVKNTSVRDIAREVHTAPSNIYNYYESKETILDEIVKETATKLERFIEISYKDFLTKVDEKHIYEQLEKLVNEDEKIQELLNQRLIILLEKCNGTKYEKYKESMLQIMDDYVQEYFNKTKENILSKNMNYLFIQILLEVAKNRVMGLEKGWDKNRLKDNKHRETQYKIEVDKEKKIIIITLRMGTFKGEEKDIELYLKEYNKKMVGLNLEEYEVIFDNTKSQNICQSRFEKVLAQVVKGGGYKKVVHIFNPDQIVMAMRIEKISKEFNIKNTEIVIKNKRKTDYKVHKF